MSSIRPYRQIQRRKSRLIHVGKVPVGGDSPITVQSMTNTLTTDVAGTVVSIDAKSVVVTTLSGGNETFPITDTTRVRVSSKLDLSGIKAGDIVTIKPDDANAAKTITVVK